MLRTGTKAPWNFPASEPVRPDGGAGAKLAPTYLQAKLSPLQAYYWPTSSQLVANR